MSASAASPAPSSTRGRALRVLYLVFNYPQLSESYIEAEIAFMRRHGVHVEIWRHERAAAPYASELAIHEGDFGRAIAQARPDLVHLHWMLWGEDIYDFLARFKLPLTVRAHTDFTHDRLRLLLRHPAVRRAYVFPHQFRSFGESDAKLAVLPAAYDERLYPGPATKDAKLVVRASAAQPWRKLETFLDVAAACTEHRFVLCLANARALGADPFVTALHARNRELGSPVEIRVDVPHDQVAALVRGAGTYLHTAAADGGAGMPISIAEAMAAGCRVLVNDAAQLREYVGDAGESYRDLDHAIALIRQSATFTSSQWEAIAERAALRARTHYASDVVLPRMLDDWRTMVPA